MGVAMASAQLLVMLISAATVVVAEVWPFREVPELCLQGPEFWCQDQETAAVCAKEEYCMHIWQNAPKEQNSPGEQMLMESPWKRGRKWKCKICIKVLKTLRKLLDEDTSEDAVNNALDNVCRRIGRLMRIPCQSLINQYRDKISGALQNDQDPQECCEEIKMCRNNPSNTQVMVPHDSLMVPEQCLQGPEFWCHNWEMASLCMKEEYCMDIWQNMSLENALGEEMLVESPWDWGRKKACKICIKILHILRDLVKKDTSDDAISNALGKVCGRIDFLMKIQCRLLIILFKNKFSEAVQNDQDPQECCQQIKMCRKNHTNTQVMVPHDSLMVPEQCLQGPEFWCHNWEMASLCMKEEYCMDIWQNMSLEMEEASDEELEKSSKKKKKSKKKKTKKKTKKKSKKKSKKKKTEKKKKKKHPAKPSVKCTGCTKILETLKNMIGKDVDDDTIDDAVSTVCDDFDEALATECNGIMDLYRDQIINALKNDQEPKEFCTQINMCGADNKSPNDPETLALAPTVANSCTICQTFTRQVMPELNDLLVESDFECALERKCEEHFGGSLQCKDFISAYGTKMKQVLNKPLDHVTTCLEIKACRPEVQAAMMNSNSDCQKGPQHWCSSLEAAVRCNALPFCANTWGF
ncbi:prosaposin isoform X2 [Microcaecilia unicolor]|uniref:Prosaposin-like isoform X2 n=1 Tax=Microcaecilia unicolor TaxID=1415580 RepID=A0A6P7XQ93_9AMPH|nr:prosaposin-like isoform X2 [Microcaecilia unicolor]